MSEIRNIRVPPRIDKLPLSEQEDRRGLSKGFKFKAEGQEFDFKNGKLLLNRQNLAQHLSENLTHLSASYWTNLSRRLAMYRDWASMTVDDPEALGKFLALVHAFLTKIFTRIKKKFDETIDGVSFHLEDGQLLINGINVHSCLEMLRRRRTKKGRIFLKGLRGRLVVLQSNRSGNPSYEKIRETVDRLSAEIDAELERTPEVIPLPAPRPLIGES